MNRRTNYLLVWDLGLETIVYSIDLVRVTSIFNGEIEHIYPNLSDMKGGLIVIDAESSIYEVSLLQCKIIKDWLMRYIEVVL
jgi:hypothetical protein